MKTRFNPLTIRQKNKTYQLNFDTYVDYYNRLKELAINMFEWGNLPPNVDPRYLELTLYELGFALFFEDEVLGPVVTEAMLGGKLDIYRIPTYRRAYAVNGYTKTLNPKNSVIIFNNYCHTPNVLTISLYAKRLYDIQRTIDVNVLAQKTPVAILTDESDLLSVKNIYAKYDGNEPCILPQKNYDLDKITCVHTDAPYVSDKLYDLKQNVWNEALQFCGIVPISTKRERLVTEEVTNNHAAISAQRNVMLNSRQQAAEKINKMFGLDIWVKFKNHGGEYGDLYDRIGGTDPAAIPVGTENIPNI